MVTVFSKCSQARLRINAPLVLVAKAKVRTKARLLLVTNLMSSLRFLRHPHDTRITEFGCNAARPYRSQATRPPAAPLLTLVPTGTWSLESRGSLAESKKHSRNAWPNMRA